MSSEVTENRSREVAQAARDALSPIVAHPNLAQVSRGECVYAALRNVKELELLAEETKCLRETLRAIQASAEAHGSASYNLSAAALVVIARWAREPLSVPDGVREAARAALDVVADAESS